MNALCKVRVVSSVVKHVYREKNSCDYYFTVNASCIQYYLHSYSSCMYVLWMYEVQKSFFNVQSLSLFFMYQVLSSTIQKLTA